MNRIRSGAQALALAVALGLTVMIPHRAEAQGNVARYREAKNRIYTSFGLDPALVGTVGYGRVMGLFGHPFEFTGDIALAAAHLDTRDFRAQLGAHTSIVRVGSVHLTGSATFITRGTENSVYRALDFGSDFTGTLGFYRHRWFAAGELGFDKDIITHITHSDWYRENYYPDAKDGWYLDAGGVWHYGAQAGLAIGRVEVSARFGWQKTGNWKDLASPLYGSLGVAVGF